jgi:hypothetical protein
MPTPSLGLVRPLAAGWREAQQGRFETEGSPHRLRRWLKLTTIIHCSEADCLLVLTGKYPITFGLERISIVGEQVIPCLICQKRWQHEFSEGSGKLTVGERFSKIAVILPFPSKTRRNRHWGGEPKQGRVEISTQRSAWFALKNPGAFAPKPNL